MNHHTSPPTRHYPAPAPVVLFVAILGCGGDPILEQAARQDATPASPAGASASGGQTTAGTPSAPPPGDPGQPPPGDPGQPPPGDPGQPSPGEAEQAAQEEATVALHGTITAADWKPGITLRVDVFDGDQRDLGAPRPSVVGMARVSQPGPYTVMVSASASKVWVGAYADMNGDDRPGHEEPVGWFAGNPLTVLDGATNVDLVLAVEAPPPVQE